MKDWEFLIQKEGLRQWQTPKDSTIEIEAGTYRIVAKSPYPNQEIEIRLTQEGMEENALSTTRQTQTRRTNAQGLLMILPYTDLKPGRWEVRCTGDIMAELLGKPWQQMLQLSVIPSVSESENSFDELPTPPTPSLEDYLEQLEKLLQQKIEPLLQVKKELLPAFSILLEEDTFIRTPGETVSIAGRIAVDQTQVNALPLSSKLTYQLRRTQTGEKIFKVEYTLDNHELLSPFNHSLEILDEPPVTFLLGEIILETADGIGLAKDSFSISTDIMGLEAPEIEKGDNNNIEKREVSTVSNQLTPKTMNINHSILPPKLAKDRPAQTRKTLELPPIRLNSHN